MFCLLFCCVHSLPFKLEYVDIKSVSICFCSYSEFYNPETKSTHLPPLCYPQTARVEMLSRVFFVRHRQVKNNANQAHRLGKASLCFLCWRSSAWGLGPNKYRTSYLSFVVRSGRHLGNLASGCLLIPCTHAQLLFRAALCVATHFKTRVFWLVLERSGFPVIPMGIRITVKGSTPAVKVTFRKWT